MLDPHDMSDTMADPGTVRAAAVAMADAETVCTAAVALAHALDAGDLGAVGRLLAPECECDDRTLHARGADAVLALYRAGVRWGERGFDDVRHSSAVDEASGGSARIVVTTYLMRVPGRWHRLRRLRDIRVDPLGRVVRIVHSCEAAEAEAFHAFVHGCGVAPPPRGFGA